MGAAVAVALLAPAAVALALLDATLCDRAGARPSLGLRVALAAGIGIGIGSCTYFAALVLFDAAPAGVVALDGAVALLSCGVWWARRRLAGGTPRGPRWSILERCLGAAMAVSLAASVGVFAVNAAQSPHGEMDAWTTWNLKSRFLFYAAARWREPFTHYFGHPDYPYFLPTAVAHAWSYLGRPDQGLPIGIAALFAVATLSLLVAALAVLRGRTPALLAGLCLLATPGFALRASWLYADVPVGYYVLCTLVLLAYWDLRAAPRRGALAWAGLAAGLAAWTKNEGVLFIMALLATRLTAAALDRRVGWRWIGWLGLGALPPLALLAYYKVQISAESYLARQGVSDVIARIGDLTRPAEIAAACGRVVLGSPSVWLLCALPLFIALMGPAPDVAARAAARRIAVVVGLVAAGYAAIYIVTPMPLVWQLNTSLDRLLFQLWPSVLLAIFLWTAGPDERARK